MYIWIPWPLYSMFYWPVYAREEYLQSAQITQGSVSFPDHWHGSILVLVWISNHGPSKVWDEMPSVTNFNGCTVEVWDRISEFISYFIMVIITYPCWDKLYTMLVKGTPILFICCHLSHDVYVQGAVKLYLQIPKHTRFKRLLAPWWGRPTCFVEFS